MPVRLRLRRGGRKSLPYYWIVAADSRAPRDGRIIEQLGIYNPKRDPAEVSVDHDRAFQWLKDGAQPSDTVRNILSREGLMLRLHLHRKGKSEEEIEKALEEWHLQNQTKLDRADAERRRKQEAERAERLEAESKRRQERAERVAAKRAADAPTEEPAAGEQPAEAAASDAPAEDQPAEQDAGSESAGGDSDASKA